MAKFFGKKLGKVELVLQIFLGKEWLVSRLSHANVCTTNLATCVLARECIGLQGDCKEINFGYLEQQPKVDRSKCETLDSMHP